MTDDAPAWPAIPQRPEPPRFDQTVVGFDMAPGGEVAMVSGRRGADDVPHIDRPERGVMQFPNYIDYTIEPAQPGYTETSGREIMDSIAEFYRNHEPGPGAPERISVHPDEMQAFADLVPDAPAAPWAVGQLAGLMSVPVTSDPQVPLGVARVRTDGRDRDVPLRDPGRFTAPASGWYGVGMPVAPDRALAEFARSINAVSDAARPLADGFAAAAAAIGEAMRPVAEGLARAIRAAQIDSELEAAKHWPAQGSTCAHVCGGGADHRCEAKATTSLAFTLPSGGTRNLPLCGPCHQAESRTTEAAQLAHGLPAQGPWADGRGLRPGVA